MQNLAVRLLPCSLTLCGAHALAQTPARFDAPILLEQQEEFELLADVDHDGDIDILAFQPFGNTSLKTLCRVFWNDSRANFTAGPVLPLPANSGSHVRYADVDGDTWGDLLVTTNNASGAPGLRIYPGLPSGAFGAAIVKALPGNVMGLTTGHADGDGITDIGLLYFNGFATSMHWLAGDSARVFPAGPVVALNFDYRPALVALDADGDGDSDLATLRYGSTESLDLYFSTGLTLASGPSLPLPPDSAYDLVALDLDSDGDADLCTNVHANSMTTVVPFTNLGAGAWATAPHHPLGNFWPGRLFGGDFDGDGDLDLVLRTFTMQGGGFTFSHNLVWCTNHNGTFTMTRWERVPGNDVGVGAGLADLDGDGDRDLANAKGLRFTHPQVLQSRLSGDLGGGLADWDGDGDLDSRIESTHSLRLTDGSGASSLVPGFWPPNPAPSTFYRSPIVVGDLDGDGLQEALVARVFSVWPTATFLGMHRLEANGNDQLVDVGLACSSELTSGMALDADGDGDLDVVNAQGVALQGPAGQFTLSPQSFAGHQPVAIGDVDGDNDIDLLAVTSTMGLGLLLRTAPATFTLQIVSPPLDNYVVPARATLVDADDDGDLDIVAARQGVPSGTGVTATQIYTNSNGTFTLAATIAINGTPLAGDVDGDGATDLVWVAPDRASVLLRTGPGPTYGPPTRYAQFGATTLADLDQDGDPDLVGHASLANLRFAGTSAGSRQQYGTGAAGTGGRVPLLSMQGPIRTGLTPNVRVRRGNGGAPVALVFGASATNIPNLLPGVTGYVDNLFTLLLFTLNGAAGQPGAGGLDLPLSIPAGVAGYEVFVHALVLDVTGPIGLVPSNATQFRVGN